MKSLFLLSVVGATTYDTSCWVKLMKPEICLPCHTGDVNGTVCNTFDMPCSSYTQAECCASLNGNGTSVAACNDSWDSCRGATSFDPLHAITNQQCNDWCVAGASDFAANCRLETYDYSLDPAYHTMTLYMGSSNQCIGNVDYVGVQCEGDLLASFPDVKNAQQCQDECALETACCYFLFDPSTSSCELYAGGHMDSCANITISADGATNVAYDYTTCSPSFVENCAASQDPSVCVYCQNAYRCLTHNNAVTGPPMCFDGYQVCQPGNATTCHYGGPANPTLAK